MVVRVVDVERFGLEIRAHDSVEGMDMIYSVLYHGVMVLCRRFCPLDRSYYYAAQKSVLERVVLGESQHDACEESDSFCS